MKSKIIKSKSTQETLMIGEKIASKLKGNEIILLFGELGSGKTTLSQGLIKGLGYEGWPRSPSFVIVKEYKVKYKIQHMDFYRLDDLASLLGFGIEDYLIFTAPKSRNLEHASVTFNQTYQCCLLGAGGRPQPF